MIYFMFLLLAYKLLCNRMVIDYIKRLYATVTFYVFFSRCKITNCAWIDGPNPNCLIEILNHYYLYRYCLILTSKSIFHAIDIILFYTLLASSFFMWVLRKWVWNIVIWLIGGLSFPHYDSAWFPFVFILFYMYHLLCNY